MKRSLIIASLVALVLVVVPISVTLADTWSWTKQTGSGSLDWHAIASSSDGTKLIAAGSGFLYTSTDSGVAWTKRTTSFRNWSSVASSSDGTHLVATEADVMSTSPRAGLIWTSSDSGATWTSNKATYTGEKLITFGGGHPIGSHFWSSVASSSNGLKLVATDTGQGDDYSPNNTGYLYTSTDGGTTWTARISAGKRQWRFATSSADGSKLAAIGNLGASTYVFTSTDSGATWTMRSALNGPLASSSDGSKLVSASGKSIYRSSDSGATWKTTYTASGSDVFRGVSSSAGGSILLAVAQSGNIYMSKDSGSTWTKESTPGTGNWWSAAVSSDGTFMAAGQGIYGTSNIWTGVTPPLCAISSFTATPSAVTSGSTSSLAWNTTACTSVSISGGSLSGPQALTSTGLSTGAVTSTTTYTLTATGTSGTVTSTATVTVTSVPCTIDSFAATPTTVASGAASSLAWKTTGCASVSIAGGTFSGFKPLNSTGTTTGAMSATTTYTLTAIGTSTVTSTAIVTVTGGTSKTCVIDSFTRTPAIVSSGTASTLAWKTTGCTSVTISGGSFSGPQPLSSTGVSTGTLYSRTTFVLHAR